MAGRMLAPPASHSALPRHHHNDDGGGGKSSAAPEDEDDAVDFDSTSTPMGQHNKMRSILPYAAPSQHYGEDEKRASPATVQSSQQHAHGAAAGAGSAASAAASKAAVSGPVVSHYSSNVVAGTLRRLTGYRVRDLFTSHALRTGKTREAVIGDVIKSNHNLPKKPGLLTHSELAIVDTSPPAPPPFIAPSLQREMEQQTAAAAAAAGAAATATATANATALVTGSRPATAGAALRRPATASTSGAPPKTPSHLLAGVPNDYKFMQMSMGVMGVTSIPSQNASGSVTGSLMTTRPQTVPTSGIVQRPGGGPPLVVPLSTFFSTPLPTALPLTSRPFLAAATEQGATTAAQYTQQSMTPYDTYSHFQNPTQPGSTMPAVNGPSAAAVRRNGPFSADQYSLPGVGAPTADAERALRTHFQDSFINAVWLENRNQASAEERLRTHTQSLVDAWSTDMARFESEVTRRQESALYATRWAQVAGASAGGAGGAGGRFTGTTTSLNSTGRGASAATLSRETDAEHFQSEAWSEVIRPGTTGSDATRREKQAWTNSSQTGGATARSQKSSGRRPGSGKGSAAPSSKPAAKKSSKLLVDHFPQSGEGGASPRLIGSPLGPRRPFTPLHKIESSSRTYRDPGFAQPSFSPQKMLERATAANLNASARAGTAPNGATRPSTVGTIGTNGTDTARSSVPDDGDDPSISPRRMAAASALAMAQSGLFSGRPQSSQTARRTTLGLYPDTLLDDVRPASAHVLARTDLLEVDKLKTTLARSGIPVARGVLERALVAPSVTFTDSERATLLPTPFENLAVNPFKVVKVVKKKKKGAKKKTGSGASSSRPGTAPTGSASARATARSTTSSKR